MKQMSTDAPLVHVVVLNYNSFDDTIGCVESVRQNKYPGLRLLVVDNNSPDGSGKRLAEFIPSSEFMQLRRNTGYAGGNNAAIRKALDAGTDYILILNPDIRLPGTAIRDYVNALESNPEIAVLSPIQLKCEGGEIDEKFERGILMRHGIFPGELRDCPAGTVRPVSLVFGAVMMIRAETFWTIGGFDPLFFAYGEEEDFCRRVRRRGLEIAITTDSPAVHLRTNERYNVSSRILFLRTKGAYLLSMKDRTYPFHIAAARVFLQVLRDLFSPNRRRYPFSHYPVTWRHVLLSFVWLTIHLPAIFLHRRADGAIGPYLGNAHQAMPASASPPAPHHEGAQCRILFVAHNSGLYGAQLSLLDLLRNLDRKRFLPVVAAPAPGPFTEQVARLGITVSTGAVRRWIFPRKSFKRHRLMLPVRIPALSLLFLIGLPMRLARLLMLVRRKQIDIIYTNTVTVLDGALAAWLSSKPHIWHLREQVEGNKDILSPIPNDWVPRLVLGLSSRVTTNSHALRDHYFPGGVFANKVTVIHNGIDIDQFRAGKNRSILRAGLNIQSPVVGICGFIQERKGIDTFVRSASEVHKKFPNAHFVVIGGGFAPYIRYIEGLGQQLGLEHNLHLTGWRRDIPEIFPELDILVIASEQEPFGRTVIEGMAVGLPIVSTRCGGPEEIVMHGETGFLVNTGDHAEMASRIVELLDSPELARKMGMAGRKRVESHFTLSECVRLVEAKIDSLSPSLRNRH